MRCACSTAAPELVEAMDVAARYSFGRAALVVCMHLRGWVILRSSAADGSVTERNRCWDSKTEPWSAPRFLFGFSRYVWNYRGCLRASEPARSVFFGYANSILALRRGLALMVLAGNQILYRAHGIEPTGALRLLHGCP